MLKPMKSIWIRPFWNTRFEKARVSEPTSGKIDRHRTNRTVGQMKIHLADPSVLRAKPKEENFRLRAPRS